MNPYDSTDSLTVVDYAAIALRVPTTGNDALNNMIKKSRKLDIQEKVLISLMTYNMNWCKGNGMSSEELSILRQAFKTLMQFVTAENPSTELANDAKLDYLEAMKLIDKCQNAIDTQFRPSQKEIDKDTVLNAMSIAKTISEAAV